MRAYRLTAPHPDSLHLAEEAIPDAAPHEVAVKMRAASLNYKATFYIAGDKGIHLPRPTVLLSDGAGEVVAGGARVDRFVRGDRIAGVFPRHTRQHRFESAWR